MNLNLSFKKIVSILDSINNHLTFNNAHSLSTHTNCHHTYKL